MTTSSAWISAALAIAVALVAVYVVAPACVDPALDISRFKGPFLHSVMWGVAPEPVEQLQFLFAITIAPLAFVFFLYLFNRGAASRFGGVAHRPLVAYAAQIFLALFGFGALFYGHQYFTPLRELPMVLSGAALIGGYWANRVGLIRLPSADALRRSSTALVMVYAAAIVARNIFSSTMLSQAPAGVHHHLPFTMGEFVAVLNGKTILVDVFPQYQNVSPYLLAPLFQAIGISISKYTIVMAALSCVGLMLLFFALVAIVGSYWQTALLFVPALGLTSYLVDSLGHEHFTAFGYHAMWPLRYFGVCLMLLLTQRHLQRGHAHSVVRTLTLFFVGALVAINNLDFGFPALAGSVVAVASAPLAHGQTWPGRIARVIGELVAAVGFALAAFVLFTLARSGSLPNFSMMFAFQKAFARAGFLALPIPRFGAYFALYLTWMAALFTGVWRFLRDVRHTMPWPAEGAKARLERAQRTATTGLLLMIGITFSGVSSYYIGRSHPDVLIAFFPLWTFALIALFGVLRAAALERGSISRELRVPLLVLVALYLIIVPFTSNVPTPRELTKRWMSGSKSAPFAMWAERAFIRSNSPPGAQVAVVYPNGDWVARRAKVRNVFPFVHYGSVILIQQLELALAEIERHHVTQVYGRLPPEMASALAARGFEVQPTEIAGFGYWKLP